MFANDSRVPTNQPAAPNIVINEIQHSPAGGNGAEFVELYNPSTTEAIDLSGWTISDGITLTIQPGTVIPAGGTMTFVANDPDLQVDVRQHGLRRRPLHRRPRARARR